MRYFAGLALTFLTHSMVLGAPLATYSLDPIHADESGVPLLDLRGVPLGPHVDEGAFCDLAAAGAGVIDDATYRIVGAAPVQQVFCGRYYSRLHRTQPVAAGALGRSRFERVRWRERDWPHGIGARNWRLVPGRTAAAARGGPALGTALHVPVLVGRMLPDGSIHDGDVLIAEVREGITTAPAALYLGIAGRTWRLDNAPTLDATPITDARRSARLREALRYR